MNKQEKIIGIHNNVVEIFEKKCILVVHFKTKINLSGF